MISSIEAYTLEEFCERTGLGAAAVRHAELDGLRTETCGRRKYIRGRAWIEYLERKQDQFSATGNGVEGRENLQGCSASRP